LLEQHMEKIIHLDSKFVNKTNYPELTQFVLEINGIPASSSSSHDIRGVNYSNDYVLNRFLWIGNTSLPQFSSVPGNAVDVTFQSLGSDLVYLDFSQTQPPPSISPFIYFHYLESITNKNDYFVDCIFYNGKESSPIIDYNGSSGLITLQNKISFPTDHNTGYIINVTKSLKNNICLLESTRYFINANFSLLVTKSANLNIVVQNVTQRTSYQIESISNQYRNITLSKNLDPYHANDLFILQNQYSPIYLAVPQFYEKGIFEFDLTIGGKGYTVGEELRVVGNREEQPAIFKVLKTTPNGSLLEVLLIDPGNDFNNHTLYSLESNLAGVGGYITTFAIESYFFTIDKVQGIYTERLCFFPEFQIWKDVFYFIVLGVVNQNIVFFSVEASLLLELNQLDNNYYTLALNQNQIVVEFVSYQNYFPNLNIPIVALQQPTCYEISIVGISMPNLEVAGYNVLLADFPYVLVTFSNYTNISNQVSGVIVSNNPNTNFSTFICPIANIRNPKTVRFVVLKSYQTITYKFTPNDSVRFEVRLPNGELLRYITDPNLSQVNTIQPLNKKNGTNSILVYPFQSQIFLSAVISFRQVVS